MLDLRDLTEFDASKKDYEWINNMVTRLRYSWQPIIDIKSVQEARQELLGTGDVKFLKDMFTDPAKSGVNFAQLAMYEKVRNVFIAEIEEAGIQVHVKATDPTAYNQRKRDQELLSNRKIIETIISREQQSIGGPAYSLADDTGEDGNPLYSGNVKDFDEQGLDEDSSEDVAYFFQYWHRFNHEVKAEEVINATFSQSEVAHYLPYLVDDILCAKAIAYRVYVSDTTGAITHNYLRPEDVRAVAGKRKDLKDALAIGHEMQITISEFLRMVGSEFDPETQMLDLLQAYNHVRGELSSPIRKVVDEVGNMLCGEPDAAAVNTVALNELLAATVTVGYIEFKTNNAVAYKRSKTVNRYGNRSFRKLPRVDTPEYGPQSTFTKEVYFNEVVYSAYFLPTGSMNQCLFKAGPMPWQAIEGANDEKANYSISAYITDGPTFIQAAAPFSRMFRKSFAKLEFELNKAKPSGRSYSIDSLREISNQMFSADGDKSEARWDNLMKVVRFLAESPNSFHTYPKVNDQPIGGGPSASSYELKNGLSPTALEFINVMNWADSMINQFIGISPQRDVYAPKAREATGAQEQATSYSMRATQYIPRMVSSCLINLGVRTLTHAQHIVQVGKGSLAYDHLLTLTGDETVAGVNSMGKMALHRYGIEVEWYNLSAQRAKIEMLTFQALQAGQISVEQAVLVDSIRSPKRAAQILAFEKKRTERRAERMVMQQAQIQEQRDLRQHAMQMERIKEENAGNLAEANARGQWMFQAYKAGNDASIIERDMKVEGDARKIREQAIANMTQTQQKHDLDQQQALPVTP